MRNERRPLVRLASPRPPPAKCWARDAMGILRRRLELSHVGGDYSSVPWSSSGRLIMSHEVGYAYRLVAGFVQRGSALDTQVVKRCMDDTSPATALD